jgi:hypothetical protein
MEGRFMLIIENMPISKVIQKWTHVEKVFEQYKISTHSNKTFKEEIPSELLNEFLYELNNFIESYEEYAEY